MKTSRKQGSFYHPGDSAFPVPKGSSGRKPCTIDVRLPRETIQQLRRIARLARLTVDQVVAVIIATKIAQTRAGK